MNQRKHRRKSLRMGRFTVFMGLLAAGVYVAGSTVFSAAHHIAKTASDPVRVLAKATPPKHPVLPTPLPKSVLIKVPAKDQYPQLPNGCEVTSLAMLMTWAHHPVSKLTLAREMPKDPTKLVLSSYTNESGQTVHRVISWGNPNVGFVGSVYQAGEGYGIYHGPMVRFLNRLLPGRAEDMTGSSFRAILAHVAQGIPVEAWTTTTFKPTTDWVHWQSPQGEVVATPWEHAVLIVGYGPGYLLVNNPLNGEAAQKVPRAPFIQAWRQLGKQAITLKSSPA